MAWRSTPTRRTTASAEATMSKAEYSASTQSVRNAGAGAGCIARKLISTQRVTTVKRGARSGADTNYYSILYKLFLWATERRSRRL